MEPTPTLPPPPLSPEPAWTYWLQGTEGWTQRNISAARGSISPETISLVFKPLQAGCRNHWLLLVKNIPCPRGPQCLSQKGAGSQFIAGEINWDQLIFFFFPWSFENRLSGFKSLLRGFPGVSVVKNLPANVGDTDWSGFDPWSGKIPHAAEQLSPGTRTTESALEPESHNYWAHVSQLQKPELPRACALQQKKRPPQVLYN